MPDTKITVLDRLGLEGYEIKANTDHDRYNDIREAMRDNMWLKDSFLLGDFYGSVYEDWLRVNRYATTADFKFTSTAPGMNVAVNPKPQYTRYTDPRSPGRLRSRFNTDEDPFVTKVPHYSIGTDAHPYGLGMGAYYSEAHDDNEQRIYLRFGEPQYMSMLFWLGKSFDVHRAVLHKRGLISNTFLSLVDTVSKVFTIAAHPLLFMGKLGLEFLIQPGRFISVRDNMYTYWATVDTLVNSLYVKRTKLAMFKEDDDTAKGVNTDSYGDIKVVSRSFMKAMNDLSPNMFDEKTGRISVFSIALRAQSVYNRMLYDDLDAGDDLAKRVRDSQLSMDKRNLDEYLTRVYVNPNEPFPKWLFGMATETIGNKSFNNNPVSVGLVRDIIQDVMKEEKYDLGGDDGMSFGMLDDEDDLPYSMSMNPLTVGNNEEDLIIDPSSKDPWASSDGASQRLRQDTYKKETLTSYGQYLKAELFSGSAFAVFNVQPTGSVGESFSNSAEANPISTVLNSISSKVRQFTSSFSSATEIPYIGDAVKTGLDSISIALSNFSLGLANPLLMLLYGSNVDLPKAWASASATLPRATYSIRLEALYQHPISHILHHYIPLAMLLVGTLPRSTGSNSYTAPFMCQLYDQGRVNIPYGMITDLNIVRGVSNQSYSRGGQANAIDIEFTVTDLNEIVAMDITSNGILMRAMKSLKPDLSDTAISNYVDTITGLDVYSMYFRLPKVRLKLIERSLDRRATYTDSAAIAAFTVDKLGMFTPMFNPKTIIGEINPDKTFSTQQNLTRL